jgi:predicted Zn-dependent protease
MCFNRTLVCMACAALMSACTTPPPPTPPATLAFLMSQAELALKAGKNAEAVALLQSAVTAFPADKVPRLRMAQVQFEGQHYGEAISHAQDVLEHDPDDMLAHSIVAVSGLRVSSKALTDLVTKNNLTGTVRAEAQDLAKLLRAHIGADIIVPPAKARQPKAVTVKPPAPQASKPASGDTPADWLNN